jgi:HK97 family phage major capsid protein
VLAEAHNAARNRDIRAFLTDETSAAYVAGQFLKGALRGDPEASRWLRENKIEIRKASSTQVNVSGGALVPIEVAAEIVSLLEQFGIARQFARTWPMTSDNLRVPRLTAFGVHYINENTAPDVYSAASFDSVGLTTRKLAGFCKVSSELFEDAAALGQTFLEGASEALAKAEDEAMFVGDGTSVYGKMLGAAIALQDGAHAGGVSAGHNTFAALDGADLGSLIAKLPVRAHRNAAWYVSQVGFGACICRLAGCREPGRAANRIDVHRMMCGECSCRCSEEVP